MTRRFHDIDKGIALTEENGATPVYIIPLSGDPIGTGEQDDANIGSLYIEIGGTGKLYQKVKDDGDATDYVPFSRREERAVSNVTTATVIDSVLVDEIHAVTWIISTEFVDDNARRKSSLIFAQHNGTGAADATSADDTEFAKLRNGANFNGDITTTLTGVGAAQTLNLVVTSSETNGVNVYTRRIDLSVNGF